MAIIQFFNNRVKRLTIFDLKLVQACAMLVALIVVKLIPDIMTISIWWFVVLLVLCALRPIYVFFIRKENSAVAG
jgi:hypothetical protein